MDFYKSKTHIENNYNVISFNKGHVKTRVISCMMNAMTI
jgi:hypothetical protein